MLQQLSALVYLTTKATIARLPNIVVALFGEILSDLRGRTGVYVYLSTTLSLIYLGRLKEERPPILSVKIE